MAQSLRGMSPAGRVSQQSGSDSAAYNNDVEIKRIAKSETSSLSSPSSDQSEDGDDSESMSEDILSRPSHCLDISDKTQLSESSTRAVWVYEDIMDVQWKEFIPDIQAMLEDDYSFGCENSTWQQHTPYERQHTVNFKTQPMTYMVKCGDTIKLNTVVERRANDDVKMNLIPEDRRQTMWSIERGVLELLEISTDVTSNIFSRFGCTVALDVGTGTVTIDGGKATKAGIWFENTVASVKVDRTPKSPIFVAAMRLRDVAREAASTLKQFPASFEVTDNELVVYTWRDADVMKVISAIDGVVQESQVEVYQFAANSRSKQFFYSRLVYWTTHCAHSVCIQVDHNDHRIYHMAGLVEHVKVLYDELLPYQCHKIVRRVTPSQAQLLQAYGDSLFDSADDCHMTLSADNNEMEVYCTQRVVVEVKQKCDSIFNQIASDSCAVTRDHDIDMTGITHLLNGIEIDNRVVIQYDQSDNRDDRESRYEAMLMCPSYCVDISDKTQLRLVDADITDLCVDAIVSTIDEHGTPNTALAEHIVAKGGQALADKLKQKVTYKLSSGSVVMCDGGQLPCKSVIHVQYPPTHLTTTHDDHLSYKESAALKFCIVNILATCMKPKYNFISVALPVISSYSNRQKMADSMRHIAEALRECVEVIKSLSVRHIVLVAHGTDNLKLLVEQLHLVFATDPKTKFNVVDVDRCVTINDCCVSLMTGDLLKMKVDATVVAIPWNKDLTRGGLATSIHQKDPNIQRQLQDSEWLDEATGSGVIVCESNILASRYVFFIHLLKYTQPNVQQHFRDAIDACLQQAVKQGIKSIAFPVLGTGVLNYPDDFVASCMTTMIESFCQGQPGRCTDIRIVRYRDTEGIAFVGKFESLAQNLAAKRSSHRKAVSQVTRSGHQAAGELQFSVTGFNVQSVGVARDSILQAFTGTSGDIAGVANSGDMSPVSDSESSTRAVWVYEDKDEQWKEFGPGLQATFEDEHSNGHGCSRWPGSTISQYKQEHTVNFRTQPMTYMVKCGDTIELSTVVERRVMHASNESVVTRGVEDGCQLKGDDEDEQQADRTPVCPPRRRASGTSDGNSGVSGDNNNKHNDYSRTTFEQQKTTNKPSDYKNDNVHYQDDGTAVHQPIHESQRSTHDTVDTKSTDKNTSQQHNKPSANRKNRSTSPDQTSESVKITSSLSRQSSEDSQINVKVTSYHHQRRSSDISRTAATNGNTPPSSALRQTSRDASTVIADDNVAMTTKYPWDSNIPSYWAPMDGSSVKTIVLHPTDSEYQLVADTFLASLGNTLATVIQIERIQNPALHKQYMNNKDIMGITNSPTTKNERHLWHGISVTMTQHGPMPVTAINARGFNRSASSSEEAVYGNGTYFAVEARKSARYTNPDVNGHRHMYWCRVLTGEYTRGCRDLIVAPVKTAGTYDLYDSVVDNVKSPTVFVIFEDAHAYPEYLITFK